MAPAAQTLFGLFGGDPTAVWPSDSVHEHTGIPAGGQPSPATWLAALQNSVSVHDVRTGAGEERVAVEAQLTVDPATGFLGYPGGWPFVIASMPDVEFRIRPFAEAGQSARLFASAGDSGFELVLEGLPVEIRLPGALLQPHPDLQGGPTGELEIEVGDFEAGRLDDLKVIYRRIEPSSVFVHVRIYMSETYEFHIQPVVPVSFGRCGLSAIPCKAVHDFRLIPSPQLAFQPIPSDKPLPGHFEWLRHGVEPWLPSHTGSSDGLFSVRSVDIDEEAEGLKDVVEWMNGHARDTDPAADFVLGDVVVPFRGPFWLPVPRHLTAGIRRRVLDPTSKTEVFDFDGAPVHLFIADDHRVAFNVESFYYRSLPSEELDEDLGLTFKAAVVFGKDEAPQHAFEFGFEEEFTLVVGYQRDFSSADGMPLPGTGPKKEINRVLHWEIAGAVIIDIMGFNGGLSFARKLDGKPWLDSVLLTADLFVSMPPTGSDRSTFRLRGLNGEKVAFPMEGIGWRFGGPHLEGLALPDGVVAYFFNYALVVSEVGLRSEDGASYFSISGGLMVETPSGLEGGLSVRRLRFRVSGDETRPETKLDGFFLFLRNGDASVVIEAGGYYSEEETDDTRTRELGFTGTAVFDVGEREYTIGLDLLAGERRDPSGEFDYFMAQAYFKATIGPLGGFEFTGLRLLVADNMLPKLSAVDRESRELRYLSWYKESNDPLAVPGDRRLAAWRPERDSLSVGGGASASLPGLGKVVELSVFVLYMKGASERGLLAVAEVFALANERPLGFAALELDRRNDRWSLLVGVDARASSFVEDAPAWMDGVGKFTGTLFISNDPDTFAIGRLADQSTWLTLRFDVDLWLEASLVIGFCLELVEGGPRGFALSVRIEGGIGKKGYVRLTYNAGWSLMVLTFTTGSSDYAALISIEAGIRFVLFGFLRIGVSARMDFRVVGAQPSRGEVTAEIRLETPWFLPDVTWRLDSQFGQLAPAALSTAVPPIRSAGATEPATLRQLPTHVERFDPAWNGEGVAPLHSVDELQAPTRPEAERLANLAADDELRPVATDATIGVTWSVAVNDKLGLGSGMAAGAGDQHCGDLALTYDLVGIAMRRRPRFDPDLPWKPLEEKIELGPDYSDPGGVQLDGSFGPQVLNKTWDTDVQVEGAPVAKKLLLNGVAPYEFTTRNPEADEELVRGEPRWPCCHLLDDKELSELFHRVSWRTVDAGLTLDGAAAWPFSDSASTVRFLRPAWAHPAGYGGLPPGTLVAAAELGLPGVVARADFDEDVAFCSARLCWPRAARATLVAFDGAGSQVGRLELGAGGIHTNFVMAGQGPIRRLELRLHRPLGLAAAAHAEGLATLLELDEMAYVGVRDYLDILIAQAACDGGVPGGAGGFDGSGKLAFLPNHEYEIKVTTRVSVEHSSTPASAAEVEEFVYFRTKGLPGLNAVARTGEELERYVRGAYAGGRAGFVYREEPVTLAFSEGFHAAVPLEVRPPGSAEEHATLLRMQLLVTPDIATGADTAFTVTADDWIIEHRGTGTPPPSGEFPWRGVKTLSVGAASGMISTDPLKKRLAVLTQRPAVTCDLADPLPVIGTVLVAPPQGGGPDPGASPPGSTELWTAGARFSASVRSEAAGFVDRRPFAQGDDTALSIVAGGGPSTWSVVEGELRIEESGPSFGFFGEPDWDHLTVVAGVRCEAAPAGVGFGLGATSAAPRGLFAMVEPPAAGGSARLAIQRRESTGAPAVELAGIELPAGTGAAGQPVALEVTSFDDRLRANVGDAVVEVDRGDIRAGRLCLSAGGPAAFLTLSVRGLDLYAFSFAVSRFRSFDEHVASWNGRLAEIAPEALGPGTTTSTVEELWTATAAEVQAAMAPAAPSTDRERVFARWVAALGLPLADDVTTFELSRIIDQGETRALLIETSEPIDFTEEVEVALVHRKPGGGPGFHFERPDLSPLDVLARRAGQEQTTRPLSDRVRRLVLEPLGKPVRAGLPPLDEAIVDIEADGDALRLRLHPALAGAGTLAVVEVGPQGARRLYRGPVFPPIVEGKPAVLQAAPAGPVPDPLPPGSDLIDALEGAEPGTVLLAGIDLLDLLGRARRPPAETDVSIPVAVLQNGDARRALVVPLSEGEAAPLSAGTHRLTLSLTRRRWETTDPVDDLNTYARETTLALDI